MDIRGEALGKPPNLRQLRCFLLAVEKGSIGRAAEEMSLSQPAVSDAVARLEEQFGATLLIRHKSGSAASSDGEKLALRARRLFAQLEQGLSAVQHDRIAVPKSLSLLRTVHLNAHIAIAEHGTFTHAARHLGISGPGLHRSARELEKLVGRDLYRTGTSGVETNPSGRKLARHMRLALYELDQAREEVGSSADRIDTRIAAGILPLIPKRWTARVIANTKAAHHHAIIDLREGDHAVLLQELRWGRIDMIVGALPPREPEPDTVEETLFADPYVLVARRGHPLANARKITRAVLAKHDWVAPSRELPRRAALERFFATMPVRPRIWFETNSPATMLAVLAETDCIALISRMQVLTDGPTDLTVLPFEIGDTQRVVGITRRRDWLPTAAQAGFVDALKKIPPATIGRSPARAKRRRSSSSAVNS